MKRRTILKGLSLAALLSGWLPGLAVAVESRLRKTRAQWKDLT